MAQTPMSTILRGEPREARAEAAKGQAAPVQASTHAPPEKAKEAEEPVASEKPSPATAPEPKPDPKSAKPPDKSNAPDAHEEPEDQEEMPADVERLKTSLKASRADTRRARNHGREVEIQVAELRGQVQSLLQQRQQAAATTEPAKPAAPPPDITPDNFYDPATVKTYVDHRVESVRNEYQQRLQALSIAGAKARHADYDEKVATTVGSVPPHVESQILSSHDPAEALYQYALSLELFKDAPTAEALRAKIEADIRKKVEAEWAAKHQEQQAAIPAPVPAPTPRPPPPKSLAGVRGNGAGQTAWAGPTPMSVILGR